MPGEGERTLTRSREAKRAETEEVLGRPCAGSACSRDRYDSRVGGLSFRVEDLLQVPLPAENGLPLVRIVGVAIIDRRHTLLDVVEELRHDEAGDADRCHVAHCRAAKVVRGEVSYVEIFYATSHRMIRYSLAYVPVLR